MWCAEESQVGRLATAMEAEEWKLVLVESGALPGNWQQITKGEKNHLW
jgi:hypothetical protein